MWVTALFKQFDKVFDTSQVEFKYFTVMQEMELMATFVCLWLRGAVVEKAGYHGEAEGSIDLRRLTRS